MRFWPTAYANATATPSPWTTSTSPCRAGTVYGLLGPNGAGKTTAVRILTTLIRADGGRAEVAGHDVARRSRRVRRRIGLDRPADRGRRRPQRPAEPGHVRPAVPHRQGSRPAARRRAAAPVRSGRRGRQGPEDVLRRHAPPARPGLEHDPGAGGAVPRRADHRAWIRPAGRRCGRRSAIWPPVARRSSSPPTTWTRRTGSATGSGSIDRGRNMVEDTPDGLKRRIGNERLEIVAADARDLAGDRRGARHRPPAMGLCPPWTPPRSPSAHP